MRIIAGEARGRTIEAPSGTHTRPTLDRVRENLFNMIQADVPGSRVLDLFAGSGALSLEALSRGAAFAVLTDNDRNASETQKRNIVRLRYQERVRQFRSDWHAAVKELQKEKEVFDLIFLDPPYSIPDLSEIFSSLIPLAGKDTLIILEHEAARKPDVPERFSVVRDRSWGFCAVTIYQLTEEGA